MRKRRKIKKKNVRVNEKTRRKTGLKKTNTNNNETNRKQKKANI